MEFADCQQSNLGHCTMIVAISPVVPGEHLKTKTPSRAQITPIQNFEAVNNSSCRGTVFLVSLIKEASLRPEARTFEGNVAGKSMCMVKFSPVSVIQ